MLVVLELQGREDYSADSAIRRLCQALMYRRGQLVEQAVCVASGYKGLCD